MTRSQLVQRTCELIRRIPAAQSADGIRAVLINCGIPEPVWQARSLGEAPAIVWTILVADLDSMHRTKDIVALLDFVSQSLGQEAQAECRELSALWSASPNADSRTGTAAKAELPAEMQAALTNVERQSFAFVSSRVPATDAEARDALEHSRRTTDILYGWLLDKEQTGAFRQDPWMAFFLYCCAYLQPVGVNAGWNGRMDDLRGPAARYFERSASVVREHWRALGLSDEVQAEIVARVFESGAAADGDESRSSSLPYFAGRTRIDVRLLGVYLRLADHFDFTGDRLPLLLRRLGGSPGNAGDVKCLGIGPDGRLPATISAFFQCNSAASHRLLKRLETDLQRILAAANRAVAPRFSYTQVSFEIESSGYEPVDLRFRVDGSAALEIFMGRPLYADQATFLRELVQNAVDACEVRKHLEGEYEAKVCVSRLADLRTVVVRDNGIGMDLNWVEKYLLPVGVSFYRSAEFAEMGFDPAFSPISRFGVGILSTFMVAERLEIRTRKRESRALVLRISDFREYFDVEYSDEPDRGTEVRVVLRPEYAEVDCLGYLMGNVKCVTVPLEYQYFDGERRQITPEPVSFIQLERASYWQTGPRTCVERSLELTHSEGYVAFRLFQPVQSRGSASIPLPDWPEPEDDESGSPRERTIAADPTDPNQVTIWQDGIFVSRQVNVLPDWVRSNFAVRVNLRAGDRVDLSISRNAIIENELYISLKLRIARATAALVGELLSTWTAEISDLASRHLHFSLFFEDMVDLTKMTELLDAIRPFYLFKVQTRGTDQVRYVAIDGLPQEILLVRHEGRVEDYVPAGSMYMTGRDALAAAFLDGKRFGPAIDFRE